MNHSCPLPSPCHQSRSVLPTAVFLLLALLSAAAVLASPPLAAGEVRFTAADSPEKINAALAGAKPGDRMLFMRGEIFSGPLVCMAKGSRDLPIVLGAWGEGPDPVLADLVPVTRWESAGKNLWKAILPRPKGQRKHVPAMLHRQGRAGGPGIALALGREPDLTDPWGGFRLIGKGASHQSITPPGLDLTVDWSGAEVVMRTRRWILDRLTVRTVTDGRMIFREKLSAEYLPYDTFGFFIQNHPACLDQEGEWCFNPVKREILLFSTSRPVEGEYRYTTLETLLDLRESAFLVVENLDLQGSNETAVRVDDSVNITMRNCRISQAGRNGLAGYDTTGFTLQSCLVDRIQNNAVYVGKASELKVLGNTISNTALVPGMGQGGDGQYNALQVTGTGILVEDNLITNTGYLPIFFGGDQVMIRHNIVDGYALTKDDCGGIYTWSDGKSVHKDRQVVENLIKNGKGVMGGQSWEGTSTQGIYMDDRTDHVIIRGNMIQDISESGIFIHNAHELEIRDNIVFGCGLQVLFSHDSIAPDHPIKNCLVSGNVFSTSKPGQILGAIHNTEDLVFELPVFSGNSWQSVFQSEGVFNLGRKDRSPTRLFLAGMNGPGGLDPQGWISPGFREAIIQSGQSGPDLITDGGFERGTSLWSWWSNRDAGLVATSGKGTVRMSFPRPSGEEDSMLLFNSAPFPMEAGRHYRLGFTARASVPGIPLSFLTRKNGEPWTQSSSDKAWSLSTEFRTYETLLPSFVTEPESRAEFIIRQSEFAEVMKGNNGGTGSGAITGDKGSQAKPGAGEDPGSLPWVEIKGVELHPVEARMADPQQFVRLLANPEPRGKTVTVGPGWVDAWGKPTGESVELKPWSAVVIFHE